MWETLPLRAHQSCPSSPTGQARALAMARWLRDVVASPLAHWPWLLRPFALGISSSFLEVPVLGYQSLSTGHFSVSLDTLCH